MNIDIDMNIKHLFEIKVANRVILQLMRSCRHKIIMNRMFTWRTRFWNVTKFSILHPPVSPGISPLCPVNFPPPCPESWSYPGSMSIYCPSHSSYQPWTVSETISWISTSVVTCVCVSVPGPCTQQTLLLKQQIGMTIKAKVHEEQKIKAWRGNNT